MSEQEIEKTSSQDGDGNKKNDLVEIEQVLTTTNPEVLKDISPEKKKQILESVSIIRRVMIQEHSHSGPLPDAETLKKYDSVIPEGADRIMKMAEKQQEHRMSIEKSVISSQSKQSFLGQLFGLIIGLIGIGCGTFLAYTGQATVGGIIAGGTVVSLVSVFVIGKKAQRSE